MGRETLPKLNRDSNSRKRLFKTLLCELIDLGKITTTVTKAKIVKSHFDKLVTRAKEGTVAARRLLAASLSSVKHANRLVDVIAPLMTDRNSGFTTTQRVSVRRGDAAAMMAISLINPLPVAPVETEVKKEKKAKVEKKVTTK